MLLSIMFGLGQACIEFPILDYYCLFLFCRSSDFQKTKTSFCGCVMMDMIRFGTIEDKLIKYNNQWVLLDKDVAFLYEIEPKKLRQQVKRNINKFPNDYAHQLSEDDLDIMVSQNVTLLNNNLVGVCPMYLLKKVSTWLQPYLKVKKQMRLHLLS